MEDATLTRSKKKKLSPRKYLIGFKIGGRVSIYIYICWVNWLQIPKLQIPIVNKQSTKNRYIIKYLKNGPWD